MACCDCCTLYATVCTRTVHPAKSYKIQIFSQWKRTSQDIFRSTWAHIVLCSSVFCAHKWMNEFETLWFARQSSDGHAEMGATANSLNKKKFTQICRCACEINGANGIWDGIGWESRGRVVNGKRFGIKFSTLPKISVQRHGGGSINHIRTPVGRSDAFSKGQKKHRFIHASGVCVSGLLSPFLLLSLSLCVCECEYLVCGLFQWKWFSHGQTNFKKLKVQRPSH